MQRSQQSYDLLFLGLTLDWGNEGNNKPAATALQQLT